MAVTRFQRYNRHLLRSFCLLIGMHTGSILFSQDPLMIVPLGNSITQGNTATAGANSYRRNLWNKLDNAGYHVDFVGSLDTDNSGVPFPDATFDHDHEGHWGWRADQIVSSLPGWLNGYTPDVALIHIGTNDAWQGNTVASTIDEIEDIIGILRNDNAQITIFLARILPLEDAAKNNLINGINAGLVTLASGLDQPQSRIILVDHNTGWIIADHTYDGVHPNEAGEERMARTWFSAFNAFFFSPNEPPEITGQHSLSVDEDQQITFSVSDFIISDPDTDPGDMTLTVADGSHYAVSGTTLTPETNWYGSLTVPVTVSDGMSDSDPFDATVSVDPVNDAPVISGQLSIRTDEDQQITLSVSDLIISDPDTDPGDMTLTVAGGSHYAVSGTTLNPETNWYGSLTVPVTVSDGMSDSDPFDATVSVDPVNDAPVVSVIPDQVVDHGEPFDSIHLSDFVNDMETPDSSMLWTITGHVNLDIEIAGQVARITVVDEYWYGTEAVVFTATDDHSTGPLSDSVEVAFTVHAPVFAPNSTLTAVNIYPNPAADLLTIETDKPGSYSISFLTPDGQLILHRSLEGSLHRFDLSPFQQGFYLVTIRTEDSVITKRIIKL